MNRALYPTIVNERDDPEYNDALPQSDEPYSPYVENTRWAISRDFLRLSTELKEGEEAGRALITTIETTVDPSSPFNVALKSQVNAIITLLQVLRTGSGVHTVPGELHILKQAGRLDLDDLADRIDAIHTMVWNAWQSIESVARHPQSFTLVLAAPMLKDYNRLDNSITDVGLIQSLLENFRWRVLDAKNGRIRAKEKRLAKKEWEEEQLIKLWPVN